MSHNKKQGSRIIITLCIPQELLRTISIDISMPVRELNTLFPGEKKMFVFNGRVLQSSMSISGSGIKDGDYIVVVPKNEALINKDHEFWMKATEDKEDFSNKIKWSLDNDTSREQSRLRDLHLLKLEKRPKTYAKMCSLIMQQSDMPSESSCANVNVSFGSPSAPSNTALPVFWDMPEEDFSSFRQTS